MDIYNNEAYNIKQVLNEISYTLKGILGVMSKPENKVMTVFKYIGAGVSAFGILGIIELIRQWIIGG